jgi:hypothetical protein
VTDPPADSTPGVRLLAPSLWGIVVLCASVVDPGAGTVQATGFDPTLFHVLGYGGLSLLVGWGLAVVDRRRLLAVTLLVTLFGAGIELLQGPLPYRTMAGLDAVTNAVGAAAGAVLCAWLSRHAADRAG